MINPKNITNTEFLQTIFGDEYTRAHVCAFPYDPNNIPKESYAWKGEYYMAGGLPAGQNQYFCISQFDPDPKGNPRRQKALFRYCGVIVLDDVKEKLPLPLVEKLPTPTYKLVTSPGSEQWGYVLQRGAFMDHSRDVITNLLSGLVLHGVAPDGKDPGMTGVTRYVRLPEGWNLKGRNCHFDERGVKCKLIEWHPDREFTPEQMAAPFDIDLHRPLAHVRNVTGCDADDHPAYVVLHAAGLIKSYERDGCYDVTCPWVEEHTGQADNGSEVKLFDDGGANLHCYHGHGDKVKSDFRNWLRHQPGYSAAMKAFKKRTEQDSSEAFAEYATSEGAGEGTPSRQVLQVMPDIISIGILGKLTAFFNSRDIAVGAYMPEPLQLAWTQVFYTGSKSKVFMFNHDAKLIQCPDPKASGYIDHIFGSFLDMDMIYKHAAGHDIGAADIKKLIKGCFRQFMQVVEIHNQREVISYKVDMFITEPRVVMGHDDVSVTYPFSELRCKNVSGASNDQVAAIVNDYREHFPEFDTFLQMICASRFADSAREGYLWLNVMSDWGKTFLINGVFGEELGIVVEASMSEIEKVFTGQPIGKTAADFIRSWVLFVDEASVIKGEIKQLDSHISGAPKNQLSFSARVYTKIFASAMSIASFAGEAGIEVQFDNRFSYMAPEGGKLKERPLFAANRIQYREGLAIHVAAVLNDYVAQMRTLGPAKAAQTSSDTLSEIHEAWRISKSKGSLEDSHKDYAIELRQVILDIVNMVPNCYMGMGKESRELFALDAGNLVTGLHHEYGRVVLVKKPSKLIKAWLKDQVDKSEIGKLWYSHGELLDRLNECGDRHVAMRLSDPEINAKGVLIKL